jgi:tRNA (adenine37-N6)-methyltransferase
MTKICFDPIGIIQSKFNNPEDLAFACEQGLDTDTESEIIVDEHLKEGLSGLEEFSHIFIIYFLNQADRIELSTHPGPPSEESLPKVGVFASRSQYRPNHIALRLAELLNINCNRILVKGLDAVNGSKVLDIKPYVKGFDRPENFKTAYWYDWLNHLNQ